MIKIFYCLKVIFTCTFGWLCADWSCKLALPSAFIRASGSMLDSTLSFHWLFFIYTFVLICRCGLVLVLRHSTGMRLLFQHRKKTDEDDEKNKADRKEVNMQKRMKNHKITRKTKPGRCRKKCKTKRRNATKFLVTLCRFSVSFLGGFYTCLDFIPFWTAFYLGHVCYSFVKYSKSFWNFVILTYERFVTTDGSRLICWPVWRRQENVSQCHVCFPALLAVCMSLLWVADNNVALCYDWLLWLLWFCIWKGVGWM